MRSLITTGLIWAILGTVQAQFEIRPHVGMNVQELTPENDENAWNGESGYQAGVQFMVGRRFFFAPGAQYVIMNSDLDMNEDGSTEELRSRFSSQAFRFPALLGWRSSDPTDDPLVNFRLFAGPTATLVLENEFDPELQRALEVQGSRWSVGGGMGIDVWNFYVDLGYDVGLDEVFTGEDFRSDARANVVMVNAGIRLRLFQ